ncbi:MAG: hypothetical protein MRY21_06635 [Simkaniaceae bacterium]|nr:hypothetical protein [Simkaniaceae bacterium]
MEVSIHPLHEVRDEMLALCESWSAHAEKKIAHAKYLAAHSVCQEAIGVLQRRKTPNYRFHLVKDLEGTILAFALTYIFDLPSWVQSRPHKVVFIHLMTSNPLKFDAADRIPRLGEFLLEALKKECLNRKFFGIYSEPLYQAMHYFKRLGFVDHFLPDRKRVGVLLTFSEKYGSVYK